MKRQISMWMMTLAVAGATLLPAATSEVANSPRAQERLEKQVRRELVMLPFLSVFDNLSYRVDGDTVYLQGQTIRPVLKSDAQNRVKGIEGVTKVVNEIEVLPLSLFDDRLRYALMQTIYGDNTLGRYGMGPLPSIRIIVKNGNVTLEGAVMNEMDKNIAFIRSNGVSGVFSVTNNLRVVKG